MDIRKNTHRPGAPKAARLPTCSGDREHTNTNTPDLMAVGAKKASAPSAGQWRSHNTTANERGTHEYRRNPTRTSIWMGHRTNTGTCSSHDALGLFDPCNTATRRSPSHATASDDEVTGPRAERGTAKSCGTSGKRATRGDRSAKALIEGVGGSIEPFTTIRSQDTWREPSAANTTDLSPCNWKTQPTAAGAADCDAVADKPAASTCARKLRWCFKSQCLRLLGGASFWRKRSDGRDGDRPVSHVPRGCRPAARAWEVIRAWSRRPANSLALRVLLRIGHPLCSGRLRLGGGGQLGHEEVGILDFDCSWDTTLHPVLNALCAAPLVYRNQLSDLGGTTKATDQVSVMGRSSHSRIKHHV